MKFGFDIDDTLINLREYAFDLYNKKLNQNVEKTRFYELDKVKIHELFGMTEDQGHKMWVDSTEEIYFSACPIYPGAVETLNQLDKAGHDIFYITARNKEYGLRTLKWMLQNNFPVKKEHFFVGMKDHQKVDIIKNIQLDYYFDDKPEILNSLKHLPIKLYAKYQPYNRDLDLPHINNWIELLNIVDK